ncbi:RidA family protein [Acidovorax sp. LjRoot129]|uniref:RidA family protein n=1 Tax=Acidovorax sp. LjRoot129 TaxID=3342260 RepID=UPI003ED12924
MRPDTAPIPRPAPAAAALGFINPPGLYDPRPNGYSHVVIAPAQARTVFVAGQGGENAAGQISPDFGEQLRQAFTNLRTALGAADAGLHDVAKLTVLVVDHTEQRLALLSQAVRSLWPDGAAPACTLIPVPRLALDGMLVEVEATAVAAA